jgi:signal transduction histidine kinase
MIDNEDHLVLVRQRARQIAGLLGFSLQDQTRIATAASEVARNAYQHGGGGEVHFGLDDAQAMFVIRVTDTGPGIANLDVLSEGHGGMAGARRLMDRFEIESTVGEGTTVELAKILPPDFPAPTASLVSKIGEELARRGAPSAVEEVRHQNQELLKALADAKIAEQERERLIEDLKRTVRLNELFVGVLGHDLRNPLTSISMTASLLLAQDESENASMCAKRILLSSERMSNMIHQLLDFTRIRLDAGLRLNRKETDLGDLTHTIIAEFEGEAGQSQIRCECVGDLRGTWDLDRLAQVLSNLIGNAQKHGKPDAPIQVHLDGRSKDGVTLNVHNQGTIPAELLPVIFEPLRGNHSEKAPSNGLGLGLFIAEQIVVGHGGSIDVESNEANGTIFRVRLPRTPSDSIAAHVDIGESVLWVSRKNDRGIEP